MQSGLRKSDAIATLLRLKSSSTTIKTGIREYRFSVCDNKVNNIQELVSNLTIIRKLYLLKYNAN